MTTVPQEERPDYRMLPTPTAWSQAYWSAGAEGRLLIHRCNACQRYFHPPAPACFRCRSIDVAPAPVSGRASIATFTIDRHQWFIGFPPPYVVAIVELAEDPTVRLTTNIIGCDPESVHIGQQVQVEFEPWSDVWIPVFRPVAS